jgi:4-amino-4-deoxy-L-arabinose transferase-like glycosyltransferase
LSRQVALGAILLTALALRIGWGLSRPTGQSAIDALPDQREYLSLGRNLLAGRGLQFTDPRFGQEVWAYRTPGYPLLIVACGGHVRLIRAAQALLDSSTVLAVFLLARRWLTPDLSLLAATLVAVDPLLVYFSSLILSETLFTAMLAWGLVLLLRGRRAAWAGAAVLALAVLVRPSAILLPAVLGLAANRKIAGAALAMTFLALLPWAARNHQRLGAWIWTTTNSGITLYDGFNPAATGASDQSFVRQMPQLAHMSEVDRSEYLKSLADDFIRAHPAACVKLAILKAGRMWSPLPLSPQFSRPLFIAIALAHGLPLLALALVALLMPRLPWPATALLLAPAIYFTVIHAASVASLRYRIPVEPLAAVLAASACQPARRMGTAE